MIAEILLCILHVKNCRLSIPKIGASSPQFLEIDFCFVSFCNLDFYSHNTFNYKYISIIKFSQGVMALEVPQKNGIPYRKSEDNPFSQLINDTDTSIERHMYGSALHEKQIYLDLHAFMFVLFSFWDNILGPQITHIWTPKSQKVDKGREGIIDYVNLHTLTGDIGDFIEESAYETKFLILPEQDILIFTASFPAIIKKTQPHICCLSFVLPYNKLHLFMPLYPYFSRSSKVLTGNIARDPLSNDISQTILDFARTFSSLMYYSLITIKGVCLDLSVSDIRFLKRCIQALLRCGGYCIVIGTESDSPTIKIFCDILGLILTPEDRACSIGLTDHHNSYESYIFLQAFASQKLDEADLQEKVLSNPFPLAIINVSARSVHMSASVQDHIFKKQFSMEGLPITVRSVGKFVHKFVENAVRLRSNENMYGKMAEVLIEELKCRAELFWNVFNEQGNLSHQGILKVAKILSWDMNDATLYVSWAYKEKNSIKDFVFKDSLAELDQVL